MPFLKGHKPSYTKVGKEHHQFKHGQVNTKIYKSWESMKRRCLNKKDAFYFYYGGRGIKIEEKWFNFIGFYEDMKDSYFQGATLDRIDNNKNYSKNNCRWVTKSEQSRNRRNLKVYTFDGKTMSLQEWGKYLDIEWHTLYARINKYKWSLSQALKK